ncbi:histidine--tRNA ligase [Caldinitratiruptor microaerophilus]|uniref:Histidine--tRNA ligase n=1 Tax=Caldinitratiruptor microaerophilus TaxID=671077 RepID=A0AA35G6S5_9FIRM|nr:histidine--tRNA ligase [Caldinitratiruptor microaerophilus]BDG59331.1 histidine--tRNA ligase [Caldinitratiruptor microaerophilus]
MITAPRGTHDILPGAQFGWRDSARWQHLEAELRRISHQYGYVELRPPVFEATELFARGVGESTDIVQKEMFTIQPRGRAGGDGAGEPTLTLRPEFTAGLVRAYIENGLHNLPQPTKIFTYGPAFRAERPQKGRFRQFHQWDVEVFGAADAAVDAEVIEIGIALAKRMGLGDLEVDLNSIGCPVCRPAYREKLREHLRPHAHELCEDCQARLERNPLRVLDCKVDADHPAIRSAPVSVEHLCHDCRTHFDQLQRHLRALGIPHRVNPRIVRGLDYYTRTVFEVLHPRLGAQSALWGGGRYDGLIELLGGRPTPGVGFALGMERLLMVLDESAAPGPGAPRPDVFLAPLGAAARERALPILYALRRAGLAADIDYLDRSLKAQMKYAGKAGARYVAILGDAELARGVCTLRDMATGDQREVALESLVEAVRT